MTGELHSLCPAAYIKQAEAASQRSPVSCWPVIHLITVGACASQELPQCA